MSNNNNLNQQNLNQDLTDSQRSNQNLDQDQRKDNQPGYAAGNQSGETGYQGVDGTSDLRFPNSAGELGPDDRTPLNPNEDELLDEDGEELDSESDDMPGETRIGEDAMIRDDATGDYEQDAPGAMVFPDGDHPDGESRRPGDDGGPVRNPESPNPDAEWPTDPEIFPAQPPTTPVTPVDPAVPRIQGSGY